MSRQAGASMRPFRHPLPVGMFHLDPDPPPAGDPPADSPSGDPPAADRTFTQEQVDRIVQERLSRAKSTPPSDYEDLKAKAAKLDELEQANATELEKAVARAEKAEAERQSAIEAANKRLVEAAVLAEATAQKAIRPEHLHRLIDTGQVTVGDDGQVTGAKEAVEAFLKANPEYVGSPAGGGADQGAREGGVKQLTRDQLKTMTPEQIVKARQEGRLDSVLSGSGR